MSGVASSSSIPVTTTSTFSYSLPSVENVMKWKRKGVLDFLQENKEVLDIEPSDIKIIEDNRVAGLAFLGLTEQKLVNPPYNLLGGPAGAIANLVKRINDKRQDHPIVAPDNSVSIFIDNSNLFIEGAKIVGQLENVPDVYSNPRSDLEFYVDHGLLVTTVLRGRKMRNAFVVGSVPPENDTLWARARDHGCEVTTYERNALNKEKKVDTQLTCYAMRTLLTKTGSTILIVAGDGDHCPVVKEAKKENWKVETWFWDGSSLPLFPTGMNAGLKNISSYVSLDDYYKSFTYITGPDFTNNKSILEVHGKVIKSWPFRNERLMVCFCELNLFGRWYWVDDTTAYLYFESERQLDSARLWFRRNYPGMLLNDFKQKQMERRNSFRIQRGKW